METTNENTQWWFLHLQIPKYSEHPDMTNRHCGLQLTELTEPPCFNQKGRTMAKSLRQEPLASSPDTQCSEPAPSGLGLWGAVLHWVTGPRYLTPAPRECRGLLCGQYLWRIRFLYCTLPKRTQIWGIKEKRRESNYLCMWCKYLLTYKWN